MEITNKQIKSLRQEALAVGDYLGVDICNRALTPDDQTTTDDGDLMPLHEWTQAGARAECARMIADAIASSEDDS
jgi:hypothetical protein